MAQRESQLEERRAILHQKRNHAAWPDCLRRQPAAGVSMRRIISA